MQDTFLNAVRRQKVPVTIFLVNGVKLGGVITWFDNFCLLLRRDRSAQLVYKHAISTVMPLSPIKLHESDRETSDRETSDRETSDRETSDREASESTADDESVTDTEIE